MLGLSIGGLIKRESLLCFVGVGGQRGGGVSLLGYKIRSKCRR